MERQVFSEDCRMTSVLAVFRCFSFANFFHIDIIVGRFCVFCCCCFLDRLCRTSIALSHAKMQAPLRPPELESSFEARLKADPNLVPDFAFQFGKERLKWEILASIDLKRVVREVSRIFVEWARKGRIVNLMYERNETREGGGLSFSNLSDPKTGTRPPAWRPQSSRSKRGLCGRKYNIL